MLAKQLKSARLNKNFTQQEVANKLNISRQSISKWENGSSTPDINTLKILASFYEISIQDLTKENESLKEKIKSNNHTIHTQQKKLSNIKEILTKNESDDSWFLLITLCLTFLFAPFIFITLPLVLIKNKKDNHLYKWIVLLAVIITAVSFFAIYGWISDVFNFGGTVTIE
ncbi:helix-turn-helix domain-containing protein [Brochothrix thermosphacta]|uniref:helix-turn-helix domain-containing protein n=1 Tax=Brochothrix thermosphacta TaxID=2756 RepID=UPI0009B898A4|nr:helix-turn-helix domain-containing protein [Brochothrix thermosphacta]